MRDLLIAALVLLPLPWVMFKQPHIGALIYFWVSYMSPHRLAYGFAYTFPFAVIVWLATMVGWALSSEPKRIPASNVTTLLVIFALWISLTTATALVPSLAVVKWDQTIKILLAALVGLGLLQGRERLTALAWVSAGSIAFYGVKGGLYTILTGGHGRVYGPPDTFIGDNNTAAVALIMVVPLLGWLVTQARSRYLKWAVAGGNALTVVAILGSYSRGAVIGLSAMALLMWLRSKHKGLVGVGGAVLIAGAVLMMPEQWFERINSTADYNEDASASGRMDSWRHAMRVAADRPLVGGGFGTFSPEVFAVYSPDAARWRAAHSIYFEALGDQGFIGLGIFLLIGVCAYRNCSWVRRRTAGRPELDWAHGLAGMLQASILGYAVAGAFLSLAYFDFFYGVVIMTALARLAVRDALAAASAPEARDPGRAPVPRLAGRASPQYGTPRTGLRGNY